MVSDAVCSADSEDFRKFWGDCFPKGRANVITKIGKNEKKLKKKKNHLFFSIIKVEKLLENIFYKNIFDLILQIHGYIL